MNNEIQNPPMTEVSTPAATPATTSAAEPVQQVETPTPVVELPAPADAKGSGVAKPASTESSSEARETPAPVVEETKPAESPGSATPSPTPVSDAPAPIPTENPQPTPSNTIPTPTTTPPAILPDDNRTKLRSLLQRALEAIRFRKRAKLEKIVQFATQHGSVTNDQAEKLLHISDSTATRYLTELTKQGRLRKLGTGSGTRYEPVGSIPTI